LSGVGGGIFRGRDVPIAATRIAAAVRALTTGAWGGNVGRCVDRRLAINGRSVAGGSSRSGVATRSQGATASATGA
jgi:hypothetical protein